MFIKTFYYQKEIGTKKKRTFCKNTICCYCNVRQGVVCMFECKYVLVNVCMGGFKYVRVSVSMYGEFKYVW